jgi:Tfp pilus assembly protein PilF
MAGKKPFVMRLATRWLATLCPLLIAATIAACDNVTPEEHIERAQEHLEKGSRNAAIIELKNALQKDRQNPTARLLLGETYLASSNLEAAEKELRHARNYGAEPGRVMDALGATLLRLGKASAILREFEDSAEFSPGRRSKVLFLRATAYYLEGSLDAAMLEFERVLAVDENNLAALIGLSSLSLAKEDLGRANDLLEKAQALAPKHPRVLGLMANLRFREGDPEDASRLFHSLLEQSPSSMGARVALAQIQVAEGDPEAATESLRIVLQQVPRHSGANYLMAALAIRRADYETAKLHSELVLQAKPKDPGSLLIAGAASLALEQPEQAFHYLSVLQAGNPDHEVGSGLLAAADAMLKKSGRPPRELTVLLDGSAMPATLMAIEDPREEWRRILDMAGEAWRQVEGGASADAVPGFCDSLGDWLVASGPGLPWIAGELDAPCSAKAREQLEAVVKASTLAEEPRALLAQIYLEGKEASRAERLAEELLLFDRERPSYRILMALSQFARGDPKRAKATLRSLPDSMTASPTITYLIAVSYRKSAEVEKARELFGNILEHDSQFNAAKLEMAALLAASQEYEAATRLLDEVITSTADRADAYEMRAGLASLQGDLTAAEADMRKALEIRPTSIRVLKLSAIQGFAGDGPRALSTLESWLADHPMEIDVRLALANRLFVAENLPKAHSEYRKILLTDPTNLIALNNGAWAAFQLGNLSEAWDLAKRAMAIAPDNSEVLDTGGQISMQRGDLVRAEDLLRRAARRAPRNPSIQYRLGSVLAMLDKEDQARGALELALSTGADFPEQAAAESLLQELRE